MNKINAPAQGAVLGRNQFPRSVCHRLAGKAMTHRGSWYLDAKASAPGMGHGPLGLTGRRDAHEQRTDGDQQR